MSMMGLRLGRDGLDRMMPMHLVLDEAGVVTHAGPSLVKVAGGALVGRPMEEVLRFRRPYAAPTPAAFAALQGRGLQVELRRAASASVSLRAVLEPLPAGGALVQFAPGVRLARTVRDHGLDASDFSPIDAAVELLFMSEAQALIRAELARLARSGGAHPKDLPTGPGTVPRDRADDVAPMLGGMDPETGLGLVRVRVPSGTEPSEAEAVVASARAGLRADDVVIPTADGLLALLPACDDAAAARVAADHLRRRLADDAEEAGRPAPSVDAWHAAPGLRDTDGSPNGAAVEDFTIPPAFDAARDPIPVSAEDAATVMPATDEDGALAAVAAMLDAAPGEEGMAVGPARERLEVSASADRPGG